MDIIEDHMDKIHLVLSIIGTIICLFTLITLTINRILNVEYFLIIALEIIFSAYIVFFIN